MITTQKLWIPLVAAAFLMSLLTVTLYVTPSLASPQAQTSEVTGIVFEDQNENQSYDDGEPGIAGVAVSNGIDVVQTSDDGRYSLPVRDNMVVFVSKPDGYMPIMDENNVPRFYYIHYPEGSPEYIQEFRGIEPTGDLPESVDFPLYPHESSADFTQLAIGDTQPRDHQELSYVRDDVIADMVQYGAFGSEFGIALGDLLFDNLTLYDRYQQIMGRAGIPIWYVPGNHDMDVDAVDEAHHLDTYISYFGPTYYSFDHGNAHFVVLDNVLWLGATPDLATGNYTGTITAEQMEWLANDLQFVPEDKLIVLNMHIPLVSWIDRSAPKHMTANRQELYDLLEGRKVLAFAGHTHTNEVWVPGDELEEWGQAIPFTHIIAGAVAGSWWSGAKDERGIPLSYQRDGAPNGYFVIDYSGADFQPRYKGAGFPIEQQMHLSFRSRNASMLPDGVLTVDELSHTRVVANVWAGSPQSTVTCAYDNGESFDGVRSTTTPDPYALKRQEGLDNGLRTNASPHLWLCAMPTTLAPGSHEVTVTTEDAFGQTFTHSMIFEVWATQ